jgi:hypothetical protein
MRLARDQNNALLTVKAISDTVEHLVPQAFTGATAKFNMAPS